MMSDPKQGSFDGWAILELMGHQREIGYVTTETYGAAVLFRVDTPGLDECEYVLQEPEWVDGRWLPKGTMVKRPAVAARTRLVAPGALYALNPCTEEAARKAIENGRQRRPLILAKLPEGVALPPPDEQLDDDTSDDDDEPF